MNRVNRRFSVLDYGARGDGFADDSAAFQAAANAAIAVGGTLVIPAPPDTYLLYDTVTLRPASGAEFFMDIDAAGESAAIQWFGDSNSAVFDVKGWKHSQVSGVAIRHQSGKTGVVAWELDGDTTYSSLSGITWTGCTFSGNGGAGNIGWRLGHTDATGATDFSFMTWINCRVAFASTAANTYGFVSEGGNSLNHVWVGGWISHVAVGVSNVATSGAAYTTGGGPTLYAYGLGMGSNDLDFELRTRGSYAIHGGRFELGKRFLTLGPASGQSGADMVMTGVEIVGYTPSDNIVFAVSGGSSLTMDACTVRPGSGDSDHTAAMVTCTGDSQSRGYLAFRGCKFRAANPFYTLTSGRWVVSIDGCRHMDTSLSTDAYFPTFRLDPANDTNDVLRLTVGDGTAGATGYFAVQAPDGAIASTPRARFGFASDVDGGAAIVASDPGSIRPIKLQTGGVTRAEVTADGRFRTTQGRQLARTVPGAYPYTVLVTDYLVWVNTSSARTINLPAAATAKDGAEFIIKDATGSAGANNITVDPNGTETIDGSATKAISTNYGSMRIVCDGSNWATI